MVNDIVNDPWKKSCLKRTAFCMSYNLPARHNADRKVFGVSKFSYENSYRHTNKYSFVNEIALYKTP